MLPGGVTGEGNVADARQPAPPTVGGVGPTLASAAAPGCRLATRATLPRRGQAVATGHFVFYTRDFIVQILCKESYAFIRLKLSIFVSATECIGVYAYQSAHGYVLAHVYVQVC